MESLSFEHGKIQSISYVDRNSQICLCSQFSLENMLKLARYKYNNEICGMVTLEQSDVEAAAAGKAKLVVCPGFGNDCSTLVRKSRGLQARCRDCKSQANARDRATEAQRKKDKRSEEKEKEKQRTGVVSSTFSNFFCCLSCC